MRANNKKLHGSCLMAAFSALAVGANAQVLVNDQFTDGDRTTQAPPASLQWTYGAHNGTAANAFTSLSAGGGQLVWDHSGTSGNSFSAIWGHFAPAGSPVTVGVGETIRLNFDVSFSGGNFSSSTNAFRFQLFNSNGSRTLTDFAGTNETGVASGTTFSPWRGYEAALPVNSTASTGTGADLNLRERILGGNGLNTSANWSAFASSLTTEPLFSAGQTYQGLLEITRTASGVDVRGGIAGAMTPIIADSTPVTAFDTVAFFTVDGLSHNITLDNVSVTVVPEPGSCAALVAGAAALGRRRRRTQLAR